MKWLFFLLLLINVGVASWYGLVKKPFVSDADPVYAPPISHKVLALDEAPASAVVEQESSKSALSDSLASSTEAELQGLVEKAEKPKQLTAIKEKLLCPIVYFEKDQEKALFLKTLQGKESHTREYRANGDRERYWVYIDAPSNREGALSIVDSLKKQGVDSFIINRGEMKNRISLGLYSASATANAEKGRIAKLSGLDVKVFPHMRSVPLFVVEFEKGVSEKEWQSWASASSLSKMMIKLEKKSC